MKIWCIIIFFIVAQVLFVSFLCKSSRADQAFEVLVTVEDDGIIFVRNREETLVIFCNPKSINKWVLYNCALSEREIEQLFEKERKYPDPVFGIKIEEAK
jgi:hypothetical protein